MEKLNKKILLKRDIQTVDTNGDGNDDSIVFKPKNPINIQFTLYEDIKNIGLYTETDTIPKEK